MNAGMWKAYTVMYSAAAERLPSRSGSHECPIATNTMARYFALSKNASRDVPLPSAAGWALPRARCALCRPCAAPPDLVGVPGACGSSGCVCGAGRSAVRRPVPAVAPADCAAVAGMVTVAAPAPSGSYGSSSGTCRCGGSGARRWPYAGKSFVKGAPGMNPEEKPDAGPHRAPNRNPKASSCVLHILRGVWRRRTSQAPYPRHGNPVNPRLVRLIGLLSGFHSSFTST